MSSLLAIVSSSLGWLSTLAWCISFYPQVILNYKRRSVGGLSLDYVALNVLGFACYTIFNLSLFFSESVKEEYRHSHDGQDPSVRFSDVVFASHALLISAFTLYQAFTYARDIDQRVSYISRGFIGIALLTSFSFAFIAASTHEFLALVYLLSYIKICVSFVKYVPQALLNYQRQSTVGWSIVNILLDLSGGSMSLSQLVLDSYLSDDYSSILGNPGKLGLSLLSISFDLGFILQHFVLYDQRETGVDEGETTRLINGS